MKIFSKRIALFAVMALMSLDSSGATPGVTFLFSNGQKASFAFASKPEIVVTREGLAVTSSNAAAVYYQFTDVQRFYFEDDVIDTSIHQTEGAASAQHPVFTYAGGIVTVRGMAAGERLSAVNLSGNPVNAANANAEGNASIDLSSAPAGVYIVSTGNGVSFKLLKK